MEEGGREYEGGGTSGRALAMRESDWYDALIIVMNLLRCIRCRDWLSPSGEVERTPVLAGSDDLAPGCLSF